MNYYGGFSAEEFVSMQLPWRCFGYRSGSGRGVRLLVALQT